ncbi:hypothetical protein ACIP4Y_27475 [Streptomyces sp. NPDC088810]|uniref:hypothetical protein n=1 Tax=Streptomyces sp. NPDC088810 TaxID=3365904 RepID=UPI0037FF6FC0
MHHRSSFDMFQDRGTLFVRPAGSGDVPRPASVAVLVDMVTDAAASLPDVLGARQAYRDLRTFAQDDRPH